MRRDVRAELEALAAGKGRTVAGTKIVDPAIVEKEQASFVAWANFATPTDGEPITAPQALLTPLP